MKQARFTTEARQEFLAEVMFYNKAQKGLGLRFTQSVEKAVKDALTFPLAGLPSVAGTYRIVVRGFPFSIFYRPEDNGIVVFAVAHHARPPGYWTSRAHIS